ncbi:MAG: hypothetical protein K8U57_35910 [Planctomycetes bacterium]|nr:hypothetical protein [Planctomycetota bacterium]
MKFSRKMQDVQIKNIRGDYEPGRSAYLSDDGLFGVHRHFTFDWEWVVTHMPTGLKFPYEFSSHTKAKAFAREVAKIIDWSIIKVKINKDTRQVIAFTPKAAFDKARAECGNIAGRYL